MAYAGVLFAVFLLFAFLPSAALADTDEGSLAFTKQSRSTGPRDGIGGQAVSVTHNGKVLFQRVDGSPMSTCASHSRRDHRFPVYSLSKLFASTLTLFSPKRCRTP